MVGCASFRAAFSFSVVDASWECLDPPRLWKHGQPCRAQTLVFVVLTIFHRYYYYYYYFSFDSKVCVLKLKTRGGEGEGKTIQSSDSVANLRGPLEKQNSPPGSGVIQALGVVAPLVGFPGDGILWGQTLKGTWGILPEAHPTLFPNRL